MKLVIQIPCYNEEKNLAATVADLPRHIDGVDEVEFLVVDDGSRDDTVKVARNAGVHHVLSLGSNRGLARAFSQGVEYALSLGADIVVNTDADNQYVGADIPKLLPPILENRAEIVVGCRPIEDHPEFSPIKKALQKLGSRTLRAISRTDVRDAASGFRAFSRMACQRLFIYSTFSYCMETLIQAGNTGLRVASVDIGVNPSTRPSRLFKSIPQYIYKSGSTMATMFMLYRPGAFFSAIASLFIAVAMFLGVRFVALVYFFPEPGRTYVPSLILLTLCGTIGFLLIMMGIIGELIKYQRRLNEEILYRQRLAAESRR